jgi:Cu-processing system permease protein
MKTFAVALDILHEAAARRWFLALWGGITLVLVGLVFALRMDVVDGALAATRFFGEPVGGAIRPVDVALRPVFMAAAYLVFYGGLIFGILACSDFAPALLTPGRIEHLLALPVRRWEIIAGTFVGVMALALSGAVYGAGGLALILGAKTGVWTAAPVAAALLAVAAFAAVYAAMLAAAVVTRSPSISAEAGGLLTAAGIAAGYREELAGLFQPGWSRAAFEAVTSVLPRISGLGRAAVAVAGEQPLDGAPAAALLAGALVFALGMLALAAGLFAEKDY